MITHTNRKATKREAVRPATFGYMAEYYPKLVGTALAASVYAGVFAAKPVEVKLFCGHNLLCIARSARGMLGGTAHRAANIILISGVAGNLSPPPPPTPENV